MNSDQLTIIKKNDRTSNALMLACGAFLLDAEARRLSPKTLRFYRQQLEPFLQMLVQQSVEKPKEINAYHIRSYLVGLQQRGLAAASQHAVARAIRAFCNFMLMERMLEKNPMRRVKMPKQEKQILPAFSP